APGRYPLHRGPAAAGGSNEISGAERPRGQQAGHRTALRALPHPVPHVRFAAAVNQKLTTDHTNCTDFLGKPRSFESRKPLRPRSTAAGGHEISGAERPRDHLIALRPLVSGPLPWSRRRVST